VLVNTTTIIKESLEQVSTSAILGAILAVVILFLFLRSLRTTTVIAVAIPVSLVLTFMLMYFFDLTLNLMTLTGLALGVGMLVDNSIVILENIYRYREKGAKLHASAILGSQEMLTAITASTLTTISVFLPVAVFGDQLDFVGELFAGLAFTVVISLASSLVVAAVLIPVLASKYVPLVSRSEKPLRGLVGALDRGMGAGFTALDNAYKRALRVVLRHRVITIVIVLAAFGATMTLVPQLGFELVPSQNNDAVQVDVTLPAGSTFSETEEVMQEFAAIARDEIAAYEDIVIQVGQPAVFGFLGAAETHRGTLTVTLPPFEQRLDSSQEVEAKLRRYFNDFPGTEFGFQQQSFLGGANPVSITIRTEDLEYGRSVGERIAALLRDRFPEVTEPSLALAEGKPQLEVQVDRPRAYALGLDMATIGRELRANINGVTAGKYRSGGNEYDILLILDEEDRDALPDLQRIFVNNRFGQAIPLSSFASFERSTGPVNISRENQSRVLRVTGGLQPGSDLADVVPRIRRAIAEEIPAREGLSIEFSGDYEDLLDYGTTFVIIIVISVLLVFGVMASQFESFVDPFIIFFTIPLTFIGVVLLYAATGEILSLFTAVGLVVLVGIVVNNGIVLVDYTNLMRKRGLSLVEACIEAGGNRLRPILMTTLTTVLGLIPVAFMVGEGGSLIQPIAKTVVGGLSVATIFTLFLIPVVYAIVNSFSERRKIRDAENPVTLAQYGGASAAFDSSDKGEQQ
jgi:HAE1 family hydrophobic/amphiphilic exporter-1